MFVPFVHSKLQQTTRVDIVWDTYIPDTLKATTREKRGKGTRKQVMPSTLIPKNCSDFLQVDKNKTELFKFLSGEVTTRLSCKGKEVYMQLMERGFCVHHTKQTSLLISPCLQEEADTCLFLHAQDAHQKGHERIAIRTVDTDVVVLSV